MRNYLKYLILVILIFILLSFCIPRYSFPDYGYIPVKGEGVISALNHGDLVVVKPLKKYGEIQPGNVVLYERNNELFVRRVFSVDSQNLITKSDALLRPDSWSVSLSEVKGVGIARIPYLGYFLIPVVGEIPLGIFLVGILISLLIIYEISNKNSAFRRAFNKRRE